MVVNQFFGSKIASCCVLITYAFMVVVYFMTKFGIDFVSNHELPPTEWVRASPSLSPLSLS